MNLVINSRDAMPAGGAIRLEVARVSLAEVEVPSDWLSRAPEFVRLRVISQRRRHSAGGQGASVRAVLHHERHRKGHRARPGVGLRDRPRRATGSSASKANQGSVRRSRCISRPSGRTTCRWKSQSSRPPSVAAGGHETILLVEDEDAVRVIVERCPAPDRLSGARAGTALRRSIFRAARDVDRPSSHGRRHAGPERPNLAQRLIADKPLLNLFMSGYATVRRRSTRTGQTRAPQQLFQASALAAKVREPLSARRPTG